jgi:transcription elongation factor Elf1
MSTVEFDCPHCNSTMQLQLINLETGVSDKKTITCKSCKERVTFEYQIKPLYQRSMYKNKEWLEDQYVVKKRTMSEIGDICGKSAMTIRDWLKRLGIPARARGPRD